MSYELQEGTSAWEPLSTLGEQMLDPAEAKRQIAEIKQRTRDWVKEIWETADPSDEWGPQREVSSAWEGANKAMSEIRGRAKILPKILEALHGTGAVWRFNNWGYQFKLYEGCLLQWWPTTCGYMWQGKGMAQGLSKGDEVLVESIRKHVRWMRTPNKRSRRKPKKFRANGWSYTVEDADGS